MKPEWTPQFFEDMSQEEGDCLIWGGTLTDKGIPIIRKGKSPAQARRVVWEVRNGRPIPRGLFTTMTCRTPGCISEHCMELVTKKEYTRAASGRGAYSRPDVLASRQKAGRTISKLANMDEAREIRRLVNEEGLLLRQVADIFEISKQGVSQIARGLKWREQAMGSSVFNWRP